MAKEKLRKAIEEMAIDNEEEVVFIDSFDGSIIGITDDFRLIYNLDKMIGELMDDDDISYDDAVDFIDHNVILALAYYGDKAPIIKMSLEPYYNLEEDDDYGNSKKD